MHEMKARGSSVQGANNSSKAYEPTEKAKHTLSSAEEQEAKFNGPRLGMNEGPKVHTQLNQSVATSDTSANITTLVDCNDTSNHLSGTSDFRLNKSLKHGSFVVKEEPQQVSGKKVATSMILKSEVERKPSDLSLAQRHLIMEGVKKQWTGLPAKSRQAAPKRQESMRRSSSRVRQSTQQWVYEVKLERCNSVNTAYIAHQERGIIKVYTEKPSRWC